MDASKFLIRLFKSEITQVKTVIFWVFE